MSVCVEAGTSQNLVPVVFEGPPKKATGKKSVESKKCEVVNFAVGVQLVVE